MAKTLTLEVERMGTVSVDPAKTPQEKSSVKKVVITKRLAQNIWGVKIRGKFYGLFYHPKATNRYRDPKWTIESRDPMRKAVKWAVLDTIKNSDLPQKIEARAKRRVRAAEEDPDKGPEKGPKGTPYKDQMPGGIGDEKVPSDYDQDQLKKGVEIEREHTEDPLIALEIAVDHLAEDPHYYDLLEKIEPQHSPSKPDDSEEQQDDREREADQAERAKERDTAESSLSEDVVTFLREHPEPSDDEIHQLANQLGVGYEDLEEEVYRLLARLLAVRPKGDDSRIFIEGDDPAELLADLALSLYERGDNSLGDMIADAYAAWR